MGILIKGVSLPRENEYLDLVITRDGKVCCYDAEGVSVAEAVEVPDHAVIWGTKSDGMPVIILIQPEIKEEKDEHTD